MEGLLHPNQTTALPPLPPPYGGYLDKWKRLFALQAKSLVEDSFHAADLVGLPLEPYEFAEILTRELGYGQTMRILAALSDRMIEKNQFYCEIPGMEGVSLLDISLILILSGYEVGWAQVVDWMVSDQHANPFVVIGGKVVGASDLVSWTLDSVQREISEDIQKQLGWPFFGCEFDV